MKYSADVVNDYRRYGQGEPCKQGEAAARTGCIPADEDKGEALSPGRENSGGDDPHPLQAVGSDIRRADAAMLSARQVLQEAYVAARGTPLEAELDGMRKEFGSMLSRMRKIQEGLEAQGVKGL